MPQIPKPEPGEYADYYARYIARVPDGDLIAQLAAQHRDFRTLLSGLSAARAALRYAPGKWSVTEVVGHLADAERVFAYRMMRIGRGDETALPGFDETAYVPAGGFDRRPLADVLEEFTTVRDATLALLRGLPEAAFARIGTANGNPVSVRALAWITAGHELHHATILRERYGIQPKTVA